MSQTDVAMEDDSQAVTDLTPVTFIPPSIHEATLLSGGSYTHFSDVPACILEGASPTDANATHQHASSSANPSRRPAVCLGIDEAGRGPVLGPMVYGCFYVALTRADELLRTTHRFDDSKALTPAFRAALMRTLCTPATDLHDECGWAVAVLSARDISAGMMRGGGGVGSLGSGSGGGSSGRGSGRRTAAGGGGAATGYNLNAQALDATIALIQGVLERGVHVAEVYVDTVGPPATYQRTLQLRFPTTRVRVEKKADSLFAVVSAASVVAKVTRDVALERLWHGVQQAEAEAEEEVKGADGQDEEEQPAEAVAGGAGGPTSQRGPSPLPSTDMQWGSGYPSDTRCTAWMKRALDPFFGWGHECRFSWGTAKELLERESAGGGRLGPGVEWPAAALDDDPDAPENMYRVTDYFRGGVPVGMGAGGDGDGDEGIASAAPNELGDWFARSTGVEAF